MGRKIHLNTSGGHPAVKVLMLALAATMFPLHAIGVDYYVGSGGNDRNPGTSPTRPWLTIARVNSADFKPGDKVLFEAGQVFAGSLIFNAKDAGTPARPVTVSSYGNGRATIQAGGGTGIMIENAGGFVVTNLNVVTENPAANKGSGIAVVNRLIGGVRLDFIRIDGVDVSGFGMSGVLVAGDPADRSKSGFSDVRITNCKSHDNTYYGIRVTGLWRYSSRGYANRRIYIGRCRAYNNHGDPDFTQSHSGSGILVEEVDGAVIERCTSFNNGYQCNYPGGGPVGIWAHAANNVIIQHCESHSNRTGRSIDGGGFDFDGGVSNSLMQYNYSHNNDGPGFLLYNYEGAPYSFRNNVVRFNISENDGRKNTYAGIYVADDGGGARDLEVYNNTVYMTPSTADITSRALVVRGTTNAHFRSNIFVTAGDLPLLDVESGQPGLLFQGNDYWVEVNGKFSIVWGSGAFQSLDEWREATKQETLDGRKIGMFEDPMFTSWGRSITIANPDALQTLASYRLSPNSPLLGTGLDLLRLFKLDQGPSDFYGNPLTSGTYSVGAHVGK